MNENRGKFRLADDCRRRRPRQRTCPAAGRKCGGRASTIAKQRFPARRLHPLRPAQCARHAEESSRLCRPGSGGSARARPGIGQHPDQRRAPFVEVRHRVGPAGEDSREQCRTDRTARRRQPGHSRPCGPCGQHRGQNRWSLRPVRVGAAPAHRIRHRALDAGQGFRFGHAWPGGLHAGADQHAVSRRHRGRYAGDVGQRHRDRAAPEPYPDAGGDAQAVRRIPDRRAGIVRRQRQPVLSMVPVPLSRMGRPFRTRRAARSLRQRHAVHARPVGQLRDRGGYRVRAGTGATETDRTRQPGIRRFPYRVRHRVHQRGKRHGQPVPARFRFGRADRPRRISLADAGRRLAAIDRSGLQPAGQCRRFVHARPIRRLCRTSFPRRNRRRTRGSLRGDPVAWPQAQPQPDAATGPRGRIFEDRADWAECGDAHLPPTEGFAATRLGGSKGLGRILRAAPLGRAARFRGLPRRCEPR